MSYVKIWIHAVWTVKNRLPLLTGDIRQKVFAHIHENALSKNILMEIVNGYNNHVHCLFRLQNDQTIELVMQLIKGESSFWLNKSCLIKEKFGWQKEYFAVSVGESQVEIVKRYIENQEEHHKRKSWDEEYEEFISKYNFKIING
jgi:putative transposase